MSEHNMATCIMTKIFLSRESSLEYGEGAAMMILRKQTLSFLHNILEGEIHLVCT